MVSPQALQQHYAPSFFGVDIERARASTDIYPILNHYFCPDEVQALLALDDEKAKRQRFFDLWALKESYIKATGLGLAQSLKSFAFELAPSSLLSESFLSSNNLSQSAQWLELKREDELQNSPQTIATHLPLFAGIKVAQLDSDNPQQWQIYFGRLNDEYRFGLSLAYADAAELTDSACNISMQLVTIESLLNGFV